MCASLSDAVGRASGNARAVMPRETLKGASTAAVASAIDKRRRKREDENPSAREENLMETPRDDARALPSGGKTAVEIATMLNVPLPLAKFGIGGVDDGGSGACGAEAKDDASESEEWDDVRGDEYGSIAYEDDDAGVENGDAEGERGVKWARGSDEGETESSGGPKRKKKKYVRRLSDDERAGVLRTHHIHVMCLLARGRHVRGAASSRLLQAMTTSCAPSALANAMQGSASGALEVSALARLNDWFADVIAPPISIDDDDDEKSGLERLTKDAQWRRLAFRLAMRRAGVGSTRGGASAYAAKLARSWTLRGREKISEEESAALFASICQGFGVVCRVVSSLEPVPLRASATTLEHMGVLTTPKPPPVVRKETRNTRRFVRHWCEVLCARHDEKGVDKKATNARWVSVVPTTCGSVDDMGVIFGERKRATTADATSSMPYVVAFYGDSGARDVTRKYAAAFSQALHHRTPDWKWWETITTHMDRLHRDAVACDCSPELRKLIDSADKAELFEMDTRSSKERVPGTMTEIKNHPLWVVERFLSRSQCIHPRHPVKALIAGEPVFPRSCVKELKSAERWKSECRRRVIDALIDSPVRKIHSRALQARIKQLTRAREGWFLSKAEGSKERLQSEEWRATMSKDEECPQDPQTILGDIPLYGEWQTEPWTPPSAVGGVVPKNDRGNVDLYGNALPPPGTVHVNLPRVSKTAKLMNIDYAPALVGFEYKAGGKTLPLFNGIVVCEEFKDELLKRHEDAEEARRITLEAKAYKEACTHWRLLLGAIWTRARLRDEFQDGVTTEEADPTARRIAAARAMNERDETTTERDERLVLGAAAFVEEL